MAKKTVDKLQKAAILEARKMMAEAERLDCNEAETRRRIERIFESVMGYDALKHLSREQAIRGAGETEHADFVIYPTEGKHTTSNIIVEIKRITVDLAPKHLKQASSYAIDSGYEWVLLTNGKEWKLYHITFGKPPITKLIYSWNLLTDEIPLLAERFELISLKQVKKGALANLWERTNVLHPQNLLKTILSDPCMKIIRKELKKDSNIALAPEEILLGVKRLLNESALTELGNIKICWEGNTATRKVAKPKKKKINEGN